MSCEPSQRAAPSSRSCANYCRTAPMSAGSDNLIKHTEHALTRRGDDCSFVQSRLRRSLGHISATPHRSPSVRGRILVWARVVGLPMWQTVHWWKANPPQPRPHKVGGNISPRTLLLLVIGAGLLAGCGASLNGEFAAGGNSNESGLRPSSQMAAAEPGAGPAAALPQPTPRTNGYRIGPLDVLDISVFKVPELSTSVQVAETGTINLPLVGEISASGRTAQDVERDLDSQAWR